MNNYEIGLLTTFLLGIFILIGAFISLLINKKDKVIDFSIGLAFGVLLTLIFVDLLPEIFEGFGFKYLYLFFIFTPIGFILLKILDSIIPNHHSHGNSKKQINENLIHIGIMTTLVLILHNIIEGMAVYSTALSDSSMALALTIGIGFHNLPLGMVITSSFYHSKKSIKTTVISLGLVSISTFCGGLIMYLFKLTTISEIVLGILLSITLGMLIFIILDELFPRVRTTKQKKITYSGISIGVILLLISLIIG